MYTDISVSIKCDICNQSQKKYEYTEMYTQMFITFVAVQLLQQQLDTI